METLTGFKAFRRSLAQGDTYQASDSDAKIKAVGSVSGDQILFSDGTVLDVRNPDLVMAFDPDNDTVVFSDKRDAIGIRRSEVLLWGTYQRVKVAFPPITRYEEAAQRPRAQGNRPRLPIAPRKAKSKRKGAK